jgi:ribose 5-phosphate isomerase B
MEVVFASDHAGFELKKKLTVFVEELGHQVHDVGAAHYDEYDDYPTYVMLAIEKMDSIEGEARAIVLGGSGQGEAMAANREAGARACVYYADAYLDDEHIVAVSRKHNDSNVLSIGARFVSEEQAKEAVRIWLSTPFSDEERHKRRNIMLS